MSTTSWDIEATRVLMRANLPRDDYDRARRGLASAFERREFARFHYHEIKDRWTKLLKSAATPEAAWDVVLGGTTEEDVENHHERELHAIRAHIVACIQSLHAITDLFAHGVYYGLGLSKVLNLSPDDITLWKVQKRLSKSRTEKSLAVQLSKLATSGRAKYLAALSNHSKHRSTVKNLVSLDMTGADPELIRLNFESFNYGNKEFDQREVLPLLEVEFNRISKIAVDSGIELHRILQAKFSSSKPPKGRAAN